jgi:hypothetical protein
MVPVPDHTPAISANGPDPANVVELEHSEAANKVAAMIRGRKDFELGFMSITLSLSSFGGRGQPIEWAAKLLWPCLKSSFLGGKLQTKIGDVLPEVARELRKACRGRLSAEAVVSSTVICLRQPIKISNCGNLSTARALVHRRTAVNRILKPVILVIAAVYIGVDAVFLTVAKPVADWVSRWKILDGLRVWIVLLRPYPTLALFYDPSYRS